MLSTATRYDHSLEHRVAQLEAELRTIAWRTERLWQIDQARRDEQLRQIRAGADRWFTALKALAILSIALSWGMVLFDRR